MSPLLFFSPSSSLSLSLFFSLSFDGLSPTFSFSLSLYSIQTTGIQKQFPLSVFVFIDSLVVSASQDAGGYAISCKKTSSCISGVPYLLIELFYTGMSVVRTDGGRTGVRSRDYQNFSDG